MQAITTFTHLFQVFSSRHRVLIWDETSVNPP
jgi:hypothetical protein